MKMDDWNLPNYAAFGFLLNGCTLSTDDANWIFVCMNASPSELEFEFPTPTEAPVTWVCEIDTADPKRHETDFQEAVGTKVIRSSVQVWVGH